MNNTPAIVTTTDALTFADQMKFAEVVTSGGRGGSILPESYRDNPANVLIAVGLGQSMGLSPAESLYRISVIKGKPAAGAELIAANVRKAGHKLRVRGNDQSCTATIVRADDPDYEFTATRDMAWAQRMGLANNDNYKKQPGTMLQWRAITAVARLACPEALYGVTYTPDELTEAEPQRGQATATVTAAAFLPAQPTHNGAPAASVNPEPQADEVTGEVAEDRATDGQLRAMFAAFGDLPYDMPDGRTPEGREARLAYCSKVIGREVSTSKDLTGDEASAIIDALRAEGQQPGDTDPWAQEQA